MPTYEYICEACHDEFEKFQSIKADPITTCPSCGKEEVRRKISGGAAIIFKGGGFYETDYRSSGYNESKKKDVEGGGAKTESKGDGKSEPAKSETKAETPKSDSSSKSESATPAPAPAKVDKPAAPSKSE